VKAGGCASKLSPKILDRVLKTIPRWTNERVLVGYENADDAGIYDLTPENGSPLALVQTVDFFTPIVDDPFSFGGIARQTRSATSGLWVAGLSVLFLSSSIPQREICTIWKRFSAAAQRRCGKRAA
jgi:hypothetical protein